MDGHPFRDAPAQHRLANTRIKPKPPTAGMYGGLLILLIWNVASALLLIRAVHAGSLWWSGVLVLALVAGIGVIGFGIHELLSTWNPIVELFVDEPAPAIGELLEVRWNVVGRAARIRELSIAVVGSEVATSRRNSDDTAATETEVFFRERLVIVQAPHEIAAGSARITLRDTMPSWEAPNNKIVWSIEVSGRIRHWPDIADRYDIVVVGSPSARSKAA